MAWQIATNLLLNIDSAGWSGYNIRSVLPAGWLALNGSAIRLTLAAAVTGGFSADECYVGHAAASGDAYDFDGSQVAVTVGGSGAFSVSANGSVVTDSLAYALDKTKALIVAMHFNTTSTILRNSPIAGMGYYYKTGASEAGFSNVSTYTAVPNSMAVLSRVEVFTPDSGIPVSRIRLGM